MALELHFLNARQGDAVWIRWGADSQMMIDMGTRETGVAIAQRLRDMPECQRHFRLLVVTHVDTDHIGGVLSCLCEPDPPIEHLTFDDVWFNGWEHLSGLHPARDDIDLESMGGVQGEIFTQWLRDQPWNEAFGRGPAVRSAAAVLDAGDGLTVTVLGPGQQRLEALKATWKADVTKALAGQHIDEVSPGLESLGPSRAPDLTGVDDLRRLAEGDAPRDSSKSNASSITVLIEWQDKRILLTGDTVADELITGLQNLNGTAPVSLDLVKAPHHGSVQNITKPLVEAIDCPLWVFSSDGTQYRHPDAQAIARVLHFSPRAHSTLAFNVPSRYNRWWDNDQWRQWFGYDVHYGTVAEGLTVRFESGTPTPQFL